MWKRVGMKFVRNTKYYSGVVYEWNLPAGHSCPFAEECLVKVNRETGKFANESGDFRCYAASAERFPGVRNHRWTNYDFVRDGGIPVLPKKCEAVRIHSSGDFFSQAYFDMWLGVCRENPDVEFWAFTKSIQYWVKRLGTIPDNLALTASKGGRTDDLIAKYGLRCATVIKHIEEAIDGPIDTNDDCARKREGSFYLLDNHVKAA